MRIVVTTENLADGAMERLRASGAEIRIVPIPNPAAAVEEAMAAFDPHGLLSRTLPVTARAIDAAPSLRVIAKHGVGTDNIDVAAATRRGVRVVNCFGVNARAVAEHALGLMLALARNICRHDAAIRTGGWTRFDFTAHELFGRRLGLVGFGQTGRRLAALTQCLGMSLVAHDPCLGAEEIPEGIRLAPSLDDLLSEVDIVSLHCRATPETRALINARTLSLMRSGAWLVNTARGSIVDEAALVPALQSGHIGGAALDTFVREPPPDSRLLSLPNVVLTPHVAGSTVETSARVGLTAVDHLLAVLEDRPVDPRAIVNPEVLDPSDRGRGEVVQQPGRPL